MNKLPGPEGEEAASQTPGWWAAHLARLGVFEGRPGSEWASKPGALAYRPGMACPHADTVGGGDAGPEPEAPLEAAAGATLGILASTGDWRTPLSASRDLGALFDATLASCAVHRVAKLSSMARVPSRVVLTDPDWVHALEPLAASLVPTFSPRQVANVWWALAKLRAPRSRLAPLLAARAAAFTPEEWATWRPQELANALWAAATLGLADVPGAWAPVYAEVRRRSLMNFQTQAVSNLVWAAVNLRVRDDAFMADVAAASIARIPYLSPQSVSNTAWAFNEAGYYHSAAYDAAAAHATARMREYKPQEFCNVLYALAKMEHLDGPLFEAVDAECARPERWGPGVGKWFANQALANISWSYAYARWYAPSALPALAAEAIHRLPSFGEQEMSNVLWAFAKLGYDPGAPFMKAFSARLEEMLAADAADAAAVAAGDARARARARWPTPSTSALGRGRPVGSFSTQAGANTLWALTALPGGTRTPCFNALAARLAENVSAWADDRVQVNQMFQALLLVRLERQAAGVAGDEERGSSGGESPLPFIPDAVAARVTRSWLATTAHTMVSVFQEDVSQALRALGVPHAMEQTTADGLFSVDIAVTTPPTWGDPAGGEEGGRGETGGGAGSAQPPAPSRLRIAIEVDGPYHFTVNTHSPLGPTRLRHRMLTMLGWTVLSVPFFEYYALTDARARGAYLAGALASAGVSVDPARVAALRGNGGEGGDDTVAGAGAVGPAAAVAAAGGALGAGAPLRTNQGGAEPIPSPLGRAAGAAAAAPATPALPASLIPAAVPFAPRPPPPPITPAMAAAAKRAAVAAQGGRGPRARASIGGLTGAQRRQDHAFTDVARTALAGALAFEAAHPYAVDQGLPPPSVRIVLSEGGAAAAAAAAALGGRGGLTAPGVVLAPVVEAVRLAPPPPPSPPRPVLVAEPVTPPAREVVKAAAAAVAAAAAAAPPTTTTTSPPSSPTRAAREKELGGMTVKGGLAELCEARGVAKSGKKADVVARLLAAEFGREEGIEKV